MHVVLAEIRMINLNVCVPLHPPIFPFVAGVGGEVDRVGHFTDHDERELQEHCDVVFGDEAAEAAPKHAFVDGEERSAKAPVGGRPQQNSEGVNRQQFSTKVGWKVSI